jgi:hypothetical protein
MCLRITFQNYTLTKDIKPIYVASAARFKRDNPSATLACI